MQKSTHSPSWMKEGGKTRRVKQSALLSDRKGKGNNIERCKITNLKHKRGCFFNPQKYHVKCQMISIALEC